MLLYGRIFREAPKEHGRPVWRQMGILKVDALTLYRARYRHCPREE